MPSSSPGRLALIAAGVLLVAGIGVASYLAGQELSDDEDEAPGPPVVAIRGGNEEARAAEELGFPGFATKNTTRVGGADATANAAGVALATFPSAGGTERPAAVTLVPSSDWPAAIAASVLVSDPIGAPVLLGEPEEVPEETESAIDSLRPEGAAATSDAQVLRIGDVRVPGGLRAIDVAGDDPAGIANAVDRLRQRLTKRDPRNLLLVSAEDPAFAMPAAAWAARSGDSILFVERNSVPSATTKALKRHKGTPVFVLGPDSVVSDEVVAEIEKKASAVDRISADDPVSTAVEFARFDAGSFGWNIADPGHGLVIADDSRPLDAAAAAPLSASGKWGPLVLTDDPDDVPEALRGYLLDIKPGYRNDPTRAFYNHAWLIGNDDALSVGFQAEVDDLLELVRIQPPATDAEAESEPR